MRSSDCALFTDNNVHKLKAAAWLYLMQMEQMNTSVAYYFLVMLSMVISRIFNWPLNFFALTTVENVSLQEDHSLLQSDNFVLPWLLGWRISFPNVFVKIEKCCTVTSWVKIRVVRSRCFTFKNCGKTTQGPNLTLDSLHEWWRFMDYPRWNQPPIDLCCLVSHFCWSLLEI